ncbi:organic hydroperoxide resistance protein [Massilia oculi]|uniref:organic hydroperoxide resistance protein n=1 Tax=Massilia oculi TaxID=945844 RepID=UPI001AB007DB|nr:organic hydroperoxide resistance protein [Massilia oculi]
MNTNANVLYTGKTHTTSGGRDGAARSADGRLDIQLSSPGSTGAGTNPEQLFAAGWSACFIGAIKLAAGKRDVKLPAGLAVDAEVDLCNADGAYFLQARLNVHLPGVDQDTARALVDSAHQTCPYSKATRGNIDVQINLA